MGDIGEDIRKLKMFEGLSPEEIEIFLEIQEMIDETEPEYIQKYKNFIVGAQLSESEFAQMFRGREKVPEVSALVEGQEDLIDEWLGDPIDTDRLVELFRWAHFRGIIKIAKELAIQGVISTPVELVLDSFMEELIRPALEKAIRNVPYDVETVMSNSHVLKFNPFKGFMAGTIELVLPWEERSCQEFLKSFMNELSGMYDANTVLEFVDPHVPLYNIDVVMRIPELSQDVDFKEKVDVHGFDVHIFSQTASDLLKCVEIRVSKNGALDEGKLHGEILIPDGAVVALHDLARGKIDVFSGKLAFDLDDRVICDTCGEASLYMYLVRLKEVETPLVVDLEGNRVEVPVTPGISEGV